MEQHDKLFKSELCAEQESNEILKQIERKMQRCNEIFERLSCIDQKYIELNKSIIIDDDEVVQLAEYIDLCHELFEHCRFEEFHEKFLVFNRTRGAFSVPINELKICGVLKPDDKLDHETIERLKSEYELVEGKDFIIEPKDQFDKCLLVERAFIKCIYYCCTEDSQLYADYFIFRTRCVNHYRIYEKMIVEKMFRIMIPNNRINKWL